MARDAMIDRRLVDWAQWLRVGDASGFSRRNVLHPEWSPPGGGQTPTMAVCGDTSSVKATHAAVRQLSERQQHTVMVHYCMPGLSRAEQGRRLDCSERTVDVRIEQVHRLLREMLGITA